MSMRAKTSVAIASMVMATLFSFDRLGRDRRDKG